MGVPRIIATADQKFDSLRLEKKQKKKVEKEEKKKSELRPQATNLRHSRLRELGPELSHKKSKTRPPRLGALGDRGHGRRAQNE
jgi:hypothetical protein